MRQIICILSLLLSVACRAQIGEYRSELAAGPTGGYVMSQAGFVPKVPQKQHGGILGGLALRYTSEKYFSSICAIVAEVNYARMGWTEDIHDGDDQPLLNEAGEQQAFSRTTDYLQIPLLARLGWGRERKGFQFFFQLGPQIAFLLKDSHETNFERNDFNLLQRTSLLMQEAPMDVMPIKNSFEYGITGGVGLEFSTPLLGHLLLDARYYYGLADMFGNSKSDEFSRSNLSGIAVKLSWLIDIMKTNNSKIK